MIVNSARFVISSPNVSRTPDTDKHEYAFIGRSNVGKSSLINMLTGKKGLAMTSSTPGKTMLINHFLVNDSWYIVDLPGYGYAQRSKKEIEKIDKMIRGYILGRVQMTNLFLLIDSRLEPQKIDLQFMEWLAENEVPFSIVFTKLDKMSKAKGNSQVAAYCEKLLEQWEELPPIFVTSAEDKRGREELLDYIEQLNKLPLYIEEDEPYPNTDVNIEKNDIMDKDIKTTAQDNAEKNLPGAAINAADNDNVTNKEVEQAVRLQNDNHHKLGKLDQECPNETE